MYKMTVWITGADGSIGSSLKDALKNNKDYKVIATDREVDVSDIDAVQRYFMIYQPNIIINCASVSDAEYCEQNKVEAFKVNALGARNMAVVSMQHDIKLIHLSTDDVFSGINNRAKHEFDVPTPSTVYGQSKYAGEQFVRELNPKHLIIRSSWVYGHNSNDYVSYVLNHAREGQAFEAAIDRISTPTYIKRITDFVVKMIHEKEYGTYHCASEGICTRRQFAVTVLKAAGYDSSLAIPVSNVNSHVVTTLLENLMMKMTEIYQMPDWQEDLENYVKSII